MREVRILTVPGVFVWDHFITAAKELLEGLLKILVECDVNDGVDHGVGVGEHVDPELVLCEPLRELLSGREDSESHREL